MKLIIFIVVLIVGLVQVICADKQSSSSPSLSTSQNSPRQAGPVQSDKFATPQSIKEARGPTRLFYSVNILGSLGSNLVLPTLNGSNIYYWLYTRYTNYSYYEQQQNPQTPVSSSPLPIYDVRNPNIRNSTIKNLFSCLPSENECNQLSINNFDIRSIGVYTGQSSSKDYQFESRIDYNVSAYVLPLKIECSDSSVCNYNDSTQSLSVVHSQQQRIECTVLLAQNDIYPTSAELKIFSDLNGEECANETTDVIQLPQSSVSEVFNGSNYDTNVILFRLQKSCVRLFSKIEMNKSFTCVLAPKNQSAPDELQRSTPYEKLPVKLDVQYGPEFALQQGQVFNRTLTVGSATTASFSCPYISNPEPNFYWRISSVTYNDAAATKPPTSDTDNSINRRTEFLLSSKEYTIPKNLEIGLYELECKAEVLGLIRTTSEPTKFYLNVIRKFKFSTKSCS